MHNNFKLYCCYHDLNLAKNAKSLSHFKFRPLDESEWFKPYFVLDNHYNSLDVLNKYINEYTVQYYVYKNGLCSEYVGFCHYRRQDLRYYSEDNINKIHMIKSVIGDFSIVFTLKEFLEVGLAGFLKDDLFEFIQSNYAENTRIYKYFIKRYNKKVNWLRYECYITKWVYFYEIQLFLDKFFKYISNKYTIYFNTPETIEKFIYKNWINKQKKEVLKYNWIYLPQNRFRIIGYFIEMLLGFYFGNLRIDIK